MHSRLLTAGAQDSRARDRITMSETAGAKAPRPIKSAEKPVSLHPLSFKQAIVALLQVGPVDTDAPSETAPETAPNAARRTARPG